MPTPTYELIQTYTVASNNTINTISFNSFSGYKDLILKCSFRANAGSSYDETYLTLNSINDYNRQYATAQATNAHVAGTGNGINPNTLSYTPQSSTTTGSFAQYDMYLSDYSNSSYYKQMSSDGGLGYPASAGQFTVLYAGAVRTGTAAITSIAFTTPASTFFVTGSLVSLYGIKNS